MPNKVAYGAYGLGFAFGKSLLRIHNSLGSCESILGNLPWGQFYLPTPAAFTLFIPHLGNQYTDFFIFSCLGKTVDK